MKVGQSLNQVLAERTVLAVHPQLRGLRQKRHEIEPECSGSICDDGKTAVHAAFCRKLGYEPGPAVSKALDG